MPKTYKKRKKKVGLSPGTLIYTGEKKLDKVKIRVIDYNEDKFEEKEAKNIEECFDYKNSNSISWINIDGLHEVGIIEKIGKHYNIHSLVLEDILNVGQRPKIEDHDDYLYIVFKMFSIGEGTSEVKNEQISLLMIKNTVITFQENIGDIFEPVRDRLRAAKGRIRKSGADYLTYALIDIVVDNYFIVLEKLGEIIEDLEDELVSSPKPEDLQLIHKLRREMILLRKSVWPMREVLSAMYRGESELINESTEIFLRDVYDHTIQVIDTIESYRDMITGMLDTYLSSLSFRMNEVMKVLTIIATIFIPLTFVAGVYGMNFHHMPELDWGWFYPVGFWIFSLVIVLGMLYYFKRKHWL